MRCYGADWFSLYAESFDGMFHSPPKVVDTFLQRQLFFMRHRTRENKAGQVVQKNITTLKSVNYFWDFMKHVLLILIGNFLDA